MEGHLHSSLRLYSLLKTMKWNHLPVAGGLYDQHPMFVDDMMTLMDLDSKAEEARSKKQAEQQKRQSKRGR